MPDHEKHVAEREKAAMAKYSVTVRGFDRIVVQNVDAESPEEALEMVLERETRTTRTRERRMTSKTKIDCRVCGGDGHVAPYNDTQNTGPPTSVCPACKGSGRELRGTKRADRWLEQASAETLERIVNSAAGNEIKEPTPEYPLGGLAHIGGVGRVSLADMREELGRRSEQDGMKKLSPKQKIKEGLKELLDEGRTPEEILQDVVPELLVEAENEREEVPA